MLNCVGRTGTGAVPSSSTMKSEERAESSESSSNRLSRSLSGLAPLNGTASSSDSSSCDSEPDDSIGFPCFFPAMSK